MIRYSYDMTENRPSLKILYDSAEVLWDSTNDALTTGLNPVSFDEDFVRGIDGFVFALLILGIFFKHVHIILSI